MPRLVPIAFVIGIAALIFGCYGGVLLRGQQFGYRDAAHFYYPLYERVQAEWREGRWPLWEPEENSGMPLLGNPTAAVFYPGKVLYAALPYPWAARLYIVAHTLIALAGMFLLLRSWESSASGAAIGALGYAFGMPVLFQYCNVIFLVGAAWLPLGFRAADRWLRAGRRWGLIELALVLLLQMLGGDPESAYVLGLCAAGYAVALAALRDRPAWLGFGRSWWHVSVACGAAVLWVGATLYLAARLPAFRPPQEASKPPLALPWMTWVPLVMVCAWGILGVFLLVRWLCQGWRSPLATMLAGLLGAAVLAAALGAVQLFPVFEFTAQSGRAAGQGPHDIFPFSLEPLRLVELVWPNVFGTHFQGNTSWFAVLAPYAGRADIWIPSLYMGGLTVVLAVSAFGFRGGPPARGWLSAVTLVSLVASLGEFTGPLWWVRWFARGVELLGPHDPPMPNTIRLDGWLRDGDGSFYWFLAMVLPGFRQFRYPSKLLTFTALGIAGLAGLGFDRLVAAADRKPRRTAVLASGLLAVTLIAVVVVAVGHGPILAALQRAGGTSGSVFGPFNAPGAIGEVRRALMHACFVLASGLVLARWGHRAPALAGTLAIVVLTADLALANARYVLTVPQKLFETTPEVLRVIDEAERRDPAPGLYRIHRMPLWDPMAWKLEASDDRARDFVIWERNTIQPKYGLRYGVQYTVARGVAELYDYDWFFGPFYRTIDQPTAEMLGAAPGQQVVVYPRRGFDLWNTRYFLLPILPGGWKDEQRGYAAFLPNTELIYPRVEDFQGPGGAERRRRWAQQQDYQILKNRNAYPRAWLVHSARFATPIRGLERSDRDALMEEILYPNDSFWHDRSKRYFDAHEMAWVELEPQRQGELKAFLTGARPGIGERVTITAYGPQRVELDAVLDQPGLVILADIYYPGWRLTIDGEDAPIYRVNRIMRGAAVRTGRHRLVYTYAPGWFVLGGQITLAAVATLAALAVFFTLRPVSPRLSAGLQTPAAVPASPLKPEPTLLPPSGAVVE
jgi:hypothetical protein